MQLKQAGGRFLSRLYSRLMIGIDVYQRPVEPNRAFVERDQCTDIERIRLWNVYRDRLPIFFIERRPCAAKKTVEVIAAGYSGLDFKRRLIAVLCDFDEGDKEV